MINFIKKFLYGYSKPRIKANVRVVYSCTVSTGKKYKIQYEDNKNLKGQYQSKWVDIMVWVGYGKYKGDWFNWVEHGGSKDDAERKAKKFVFVEDIERFNNQQKKEAEEQYKKWEKTI